MVEEVLKNIIKTGEHTFLFGFPHPSGANGHRKKQFQQNKDSFISAINQWANKCL